MPLIVIALWILVTLVLATLWLREIRRHREMEQRWARAAVMLRSYQYDGKADYALQFEREKNELARRNTCLMEELKTLADEHSVVCRQNTNMAKALKKAGERWNGVKKVVLDAFECPDLNYEAAIHPSHEMNGSVLNCCIHCGYFAGTPEISFPCSRRLAGVTEPCCGCGEEYPRSDLLSGHIYCPKCRAPDVTHVVSCTATMRPHA